MKRKLLAYSCMITVMMFCAGTAFGDVLLGTTGAGKDGGSTLVEIDSETGATIRTIGFVGYIVNGMEYDATTGKLYGSTSINDTYNGLIETDIDTGAGTEIGVHRWGLIPDGSCYNNTETAVTNITVDSEGRMYGMWEPCQSDLVAIDKATGKATRVGESGIEFTCAYGLDFDNSDVLYMDNSWCDINVYTVDPSTGSADSVGESETYTHHGEFHPETNLYYGISNNLDDRSLIVADLSEFSIISTFAGLDDSMHTLTFVPPYNMDVDIDKAKIDFKDKPSSDKFDVKGEISVLAKASHGIDPPNEYVTVRVGTSSITIPFGSFEENEKGSVRSYPKNLNC